MDFDQVVDELYGLPPSEFTAARDRRVKEARVAGNRELAGRIQRLRRPTVSAWLANLLVRQRAGEVARLLDLGAAMREAQQALEGADLMTLSRQRDQVVHALGREARRLAAETGYRVGGDAGVELEETLRAAMVDGAAGDALRAGRTTTALHADGGGFGFAEPAGAAQPVRSVESVPAQKPAAQQKAGRDRLGSQRAAADDAVRRAEQEVEEAERSMAAAAELVQREEDEGTDRRRRLGELEAEVNRVRAEDSLSQRQLRRLQVQLATAGKHADQARRRLSQTRSRRDRLGD